MRVLLLVLALLAPIEQLDLAVQRAVQASRSPQAEPAMKGASRMGRAANVLGVLLAIAVFDAAAGPATARLALAAMVPTNLVVEGLKRATFRARPDGEHKRSNASFPSSHAANAAALAWVFAQRWRRLAPAFWALALVVSYSRMYLNRHYLSDVVVGFAIGVACAWLAARWLRSRRARRLAPAVGAAGRGDAPRETGAQPAPADPPVARAGRGPESPPETRIP